MFAMWWPNNRLVQEWNIEEEQKKRELFFLSFRFASFVRVIGIVFERIRADF